MTVPVRLEHVTKSFGSVHAVRDISLALAAGETTALVGHNGAGKTTLMKLMLGLIRPTAGTITVLGDHPAAGEFAGRRAIGYLPENVSFNAALTAREILRFYARLKRQSASAVDALIERVELANAADRRVGTFSKGMRQRLGLAQALLGEPRLLLLDEPTTGLDPALRIAFYDIIEELRAGGATVLLSSHALTELEERAGRVVIMNRGLKVADGTLDELRTLARLPTRIRVTTTPGASDTAADWLGITGNWRLRGTVIEVDAAPENKIDILRHLSREGLPIQSLDVVPPSLDDLYAHFLRAEAAA